SYKEMATDLGISQSRISQWKNGQYWPGASEIAYFAIEAGLDVMETIAQIESEKKPTLSNVWKRVGVLGGNGGIRTVDETRNRCHRAHPPKALTGPFFLNLLC